MSEAGPGEIALKTLMMSPLALIWISATGEIAYFNPAAERLFHLSQRRVIGRQLAELSPFGGFLWDHIAPAFQAGRALVIHDAYFDAPDGPAQRFALDLTPDEAGGCLAIRPWPQMGEHPKSEGAAEAAIGFGRLLSHELKNPLAGARGAAQLILHSDPEECRDLVPLIMREIDRAQRIAERWSKIGDIAPEPFEALNLHEIAREAAQSARHSLNPRISVRELYDPSLPPILGDRDLLIQAVLNLIINAGEALKEVEAPRIDIRTRFRDVVPGAFCPKARLSLDVLDNGPGVDPRLGTDVFSPFVSSKPAGEGLGLAFVSRIAALHGGGVEYQRQRVRTQFCLYLPHTSG